MWAGVTLITALEFTQLRNLVNPQTTLTLENICKYSEPTTTVKLIYQESVCFFSQCPVLHSSPRPVHFKRFLAKMA